MITNVILAIVGFILIMGRIPYIRDYVNSRYYHRLNSNLNSKLSHGIDMTDDDVVINIDSVLDEYKVTFDKIREFRWDNTVKRIDTGIVYYDLLATSTGLVVHITETVLGYASKDRIGKMRVNCMSRLIREFNRELSNDMSTLHDYAGYEYIKNRISRILLDTLVRNKVVNARWSLYRILRLILLIK